MSVSLSYVSESVVPVAIRHLITADAKSIKRDWWCESIVFFDDPSARGKVSGNTKLFLVGYSTSNGKYVEVDPEDDTFMAFREAEFIVSRLSLWSQKHKITWVLDCDGAPCGEISAGEPEDTLTEFLQSLGSAFGKIERGSKADQRATNLLKTHAARNST